MAITSRLAGGLRPRRAPLTRSLAGTPSPRSVRAGSFATLARAATVVLTAAALVNCSQKLKFSTDDSATVLSHQTITAQNPAERGAHKVSALRCPFAPLSHARLRLTPPRLRR